MRQVFCEGCGAVLPHGIYSNNEFTPWDKDQTGPDSIRRDQVLSTPLLTFGKLQFPDKLAFSAAALALKRIPDASGDSSGICIAVPYGSLTTDLFFMESIRNNFPSPGYFSATLPSSTIADVAIYFKFKGPDRVFSGGNGATFESLTSALRMVQIGKADRMLACAVWAIDTANEDKVPELGNIKNAAFCFYLTASPSDSSAPKISYTIDDVLHDYTPEQEFTFYSSLFEAIAKKMCKQLPFTEQTVNNYITIG